MEKKIERMLREIKRYLKERYGDKIRKVILYGSYARGEETKDSDVDVMIVVSDDTDTREVERSLDSLLGNFLLEYEEIVTVIAIKEKEYQFDESDLLINVRREGIVI